MTDSSSSSNKFISVKNWSDESKTMLVIIGLGLLLAALAVAITALVLVLEARHTVGQQKIEIEKTSENLEEVKNEYEDFALNTTKFIAQTNDSDEDVNEKLLSLFRDAGIHEYDHFQSWTAGQKKCEDKRYVLCSFEDLFPKKGVLFKVIANLGEDEWVPVSNKFNDWAQIGTGGNREMTYFGRYGRAPELGSNQNAITARRLFCCLSAFGKDDE